MTKTITINVLKWNFEYGTEGYWVWAQAFDHDDNSYDITSFDGKAFSVDYTNEEDVEDNISFCFSLDSAIETAQLHYVRRVVGRPAVMAQTEHIIRTTEAALAANLPTIELSIAE